MINLRSVENILRKDAEASSALAKEPLQRDDGADDRSYRVVGLEFSFGVRSLLDALDHELRDRQTFKVGVRCCVHDAAV